MSNQNQMAVPVIHVRYEGRSIDVPQSELDLGPLSTNEQVLSAVAQHVGATNLRGYVVEKEAGGGVTVRPEAVFGQPVA